MNWFAGSHRTKAMGTGSVRNPIPRSTWTSAYHLITYFYPGGVEGYLTSIKGPLTARYREVREQFYGTNGVLETSRNYFRLHGRSDSALGAEVGPGQDVRDHSL